jgi:hypothetical protein
MASYYGNNFSHSEHKQRDLEAARHQRKLVRHLEQTKKLKKAAHHASTQKPKGGGWSKNRRRSLALDLSDQTVQRQVKIQARHKENLRQMRNLFVESAVVEGGVRNLFKAIDKDNSGGVSIKELRLYLSNQGQQALFEGVDLEMIHQSLDTSSNGLLELDELTKFIGHLKTSAPPNKEKKLCKTLFNPEVKTLKTRIGGWEEVRRGQVLASPVRGSKQTNRERAWAHSQFEMFEKLQATLNNPKPLSPPPQLTKHWAEMSPLERHEHKLLRHQMDRIKVRSKIKLIDSASNHNSASNRQTTMSPVKLSGGSTPSLLPVSARAKNMQLRQGDYHKQRSDKVLNKMKERGEDYSGGFRSMDCQSIGTSCARALPKAG